VLKVFTGLGTITDPLSGGAFAGSIIPASRFWSLGRPVVCSARRWPAYCASSASSSPKLPPAAGRILQPKSICL